MIAEFVEFINHAPGAWSEQASELPDQALRDACADTADEDTSREIRDRLVPSHRHQNFQTLALPNFLRLPIPPCASHVAMTARCRRAGSPPGSRVGSTSQPRSTSSMTTTPHLPAPERVADAPLAALEVTDPTARVHANASPSEDWHD